MALTARDALVAVERIVGRVPDDAFFYLVIARNLAAGRGFSFDGVDATTGFHPLWLGLAAMLPVETPDGGLRALIVLHGVVVVVTALVFDAVLRRAGVATREAGIVAAAAGAWGATAYGIGMETALVAVLGLGAVWVGLGASGGRVGASPGGVGLPAGIGVAAPHMAGGRVGGAAAFGVGVLTGLARVDALPLLFGAGRRAPVALLGGLVGVGATLLFNRVVAGEWASTSARLKGMGTVAERLGRLDVEAVWRHAPGPAVGALAVVGMAAVMGMLGGPPSRWREGRRQAETGVGAGSPSVEPFPAAGGRGWTATSGSASMRAVPSALWMGAAGGIAWLCASYLFNNLVGPWYHLPVAWLFVAVGACAASRSRVLLVVLVVGLLRGVGLPGPGQHATVVEAAREVGAATTADARIVAEDFPGMLAWFSERTVFPADGLAAGPGYREALAEGRAFAWWEARGATHWMVTRRRVVWEAERPLMDRIAPPFLPVAPTPVPLDPARRCVGRADPGGRLFALYVLAGECGR